MYNVYIDIAVVTEWSRALDIRLSNCMVLQCINSVSSNPDEGRTTICQLKHLILTLMSSMFRCVYMYSMPLCYNIQLTKLSPVRVFQRNIFVKW